MLWFASLRVMKEGVRRKAIGASAGLGALLLLAALAWAVLSPPSGLTATAGNAQVTLSWNAIAGATGYNVYSSTTSSMTGFAKVNTAPVTPLSYVDMGLTNGTTYFYKVSSLDGSGEGSLSNSVSAVPLAPPAAPTGLAINVGDTRASVVWTSVAGASSYRCDISPDNTNWTLAKTIQSTQSGQFGFVQSGLTPSTTYYFRVRASNAGGDGPYCATVARKTKLPAPTLSGTLGDGQVGNGQVALSWNAIPGATYYVVSRKLSTDTVWSEIAVLTGNGSTTYPATGLVKGTSYDFMVRAEDGVGAEQSYPSAPVTLVPIAAPVAPIGLTASSANASVALSWSATTGATGYKLFRSNTSGTYGVTPLATLGAVTSYADSGLTNGTTYYYVLKASNAGGDSPASNEVSTTPLAAPVAPSSLTATPGNATVALSWTASVNATSYKVFRATTTGGYGVTPLGTPTDTTYTDTTALNGTTYYYVVKATGIGGDSSVSNEVIATPSTAPQSVTATAGNAQITLSWSAVTSATSYQVFRSTTSGNYSATPLVTVTTTTYPNTGLSNGVKYFYVVKAVVAGVASAASNEVFATPAAPPLGPNYINAYGGLSRVLVTWQTIANATSYTIKRATTSTGPFSVVASNVIGTIYTDTGLTTNATFYYRVTASNGGGTSPDSPTASATTTATDSFNLQAMGGTSQATLKWNTNADILWISTKQGGPYSPCIDYSDGGWIPSPTNVTGLTNGTTYYFVASYSYGSTLSNEASATPLAAPTGLTATGGKNRVDLSWGAVMGATGYQVFRSTASRAYDLTTPLATTTTPTYTDSGLTDDTLRYYVVRAIAPNSNSKFSSEGSVRPLVPVILAVPLASATKTGVSLSWSPNRFPSFASYTIYRAGQTGVTPANGTLVTTITNQATTTFFDSAPQAASPGNSYYYIVVVNSNASESAVSNEGAVTLSSSDLTLRLSASPTDGGASLQWGYGAVTSPAGITGYNVKRATTSGGPYSTLTPSLSANTSSFSDSGLTNGTTYYYRVAPVFGTGEGPASNEASVTPVRAIPTGNLVLSGMAVTPQSNQLAWTPSTRPVQYVVWRQVGTANWTPIATVAPSASPSYTDTGLTANLIYAYRVRATNEAGDSTDSNIVIPAATVPLKPGVPTFGTVTSSSIQVIAPALPLGASSFNLYIDTSYNQGGDLVPVAIGLSGGASFTVSGLLPRAGYGFFVRAINAFGATPGPIAFQSTQAATYTGVPTVPILASVTYDVVNAAVNPPTKGHIIRVFGAWPQGAASETVQWAVGTDATAFTANNPELPIDTGGDGWPSATSIKPLLGSTTYVLRLKATFTTGTAPNVTTTTAYGPTITVTTLPDPPDAPSAPAVVAGTLTDHSLSMSVPPLPARATGLRLYYGTALGVDSNGIPYQNDPNGDGNYTAPFLPVSAGATTLTVPNLTGAQAIQFIWCASNTSASTCGPITTLTTQGTGLAAPDPPSFLNLTQSSVEVITPVNVTDFRYPGSQPMLLLQAKPTGSDDTAYQTLLFDNGSPSGYYRRLTSSGTAPITAHPEVRPLDLQRRLFVSQLLAGQSYTFRFVAYISNNQGTTQTNGAPATITMPTESLVWSPGSLSCSGIRYPWSGLSASGGQVYHLNAHSAANWDILTHTLAGFSWNQPLSGACVYAWSADSGAFPEGIKGSNVLWQAPSVSVPTDITLYLQVTPVGAIGRRESGTRNTTPILPTDRPNQFEVTVHVNP